MLDHMYPNPLRGEGVQEPQRRLRSYFFAFAYG